MGQDVMWSRRVHGQVYLSTFGIIPGTAPTTIRPRGDCCTNGYQIGQSRRIADHDSKPSIFHLKLSSPSPRYTCITSENTLDRWSFCEFIQAPGAESVPDTVYKKCSLSDDCITRTIFATVTERDGRFSSTSRTFGQAGRWLTPPARRHYVRVSIELNFGVA